MLYNFLRFPAPGNRGSGFLVGLASAFGFALVPFLLTAGDRELAFNTAVTKI
jgi:hypothetical protein